MDAAEIVEQNTAPPGSSLYYALLHLPPERREAIGALFALRDEALGILRDISEPQVRAAKAAWWGEQLVGSGAQHPVIELLDRHHRLVDKSRLQPVFSAVSGYVHEVGFDSETQLLRFCQGVSGTVFTLVSEILGEGASVPGDYALAAGTALQLTLHVSECAADLEKRNIFIPRTELEAFGVERQRLFAHQHDEQIAQLMTLQIRRAMDYHGRALGCLAPPSRHAQLTGIILHNISLALLEEIRRDGCRIAQHQIALTPLRKLWIAWRTRRMEARRERRRKKTTDK